MRCLSILAPTSCVAHRAAIPTCSGERPPGIAQGHPEEKRAQWLVPGISQECVRTLVEAHGTPESNTGGPSLDRKPSQPQTGITIHVVSSLLGNALSQTAQTKKAAQFWALDATSHSPGGVRHERGSQTHGGAPLPTRRHRRPVRVMVNPRKKRLHSAMGSPASSCVALSLWAQVRAAGEEDGGGTALGEVCVGSRQWPRPGSAHALGSVSPVSTEQTVLRGGRERRHKRAGEGAQGWGWGCLSPPACSFLYSSGSSGPLRSWRSWLGRGSCLRSPPFPPISDSPSLSKQAHLYQCHLLSSSQWPSEIKVLMPFGKIRKQKLREVGSSVKDRATWKVQSWGVNTRFRPRRPAQWFPHPAHSGRQCYGASSQCVLPHT